MTLDQPITLRIGFEVVCRFNERNVSFARERRGDSATKFGMGVDARPDGRSADG